VCIAVAPHAEQVIGIDAAADRGSTKVVPSNCRFFIRDIVSPFIPENSADIVYSNQVLEHLHPDDCMKVISNAFSALKPGGLFINIVPNWLTGPHDVSRHFTVRAEGLHLHEYDNRELSQILRNAGFRRCRSYVGKTGMCFPVPAVIVGSIEAVLENLPRSWQRNFVVRGIIGIRMVATKP
jgi:SAM-dependent methyltransferase